MAAHMLIRPRGGDFVYSADEADVMARDIRATKEVGVDGVVIGALTPSGAIDVPLAARLIAVRTACSPPAVPRRPSKEPT
jgi:copper homeostasis protein